MQELSILDIRIDVSGATDALDELNKKSLELQATQNTLKASNKELTATIASLDKQLKDKTISQEEHDKAVAASSAAIVENKTKLSLLSNEMANNNAAIKANVTLLTSQEKSIGAMRAELAQVSRSWSKLTADEIANTDKGRTLNAQKQQLTETLKRLEAATGDNRRNVGNYTESILQATAAARTMQGGISGLASGFAGAIGSVTAFNTALLANPYAAVASAIIGIVAALDRLVKRNSESADAMDRTFEMMKTAGLRALDSLAKGVTMYVKAYGYLVDKFITVGNALGMISDSTKNATKAAGEYADEQEAIYDKETELLPLLQQKRIAIAQLRETVVDQTLSEKERLAAGNKAIALMDEEARMSEDLAKRKYMVMKNRAALTITTDEEKRAIAEAYVAWKGIEEENITRQRKFFGQLSGLRKQINDGERKASEERIAIAKKNAEEVAKYEAMKVAAIEEGQRKTAEIMGKGIAEYSGKVKADQEQELADKKSHAAAVMQSEQENLAARLTKNAETIRDIRMLEMSNEYDQKREELSQKQQDEVTAAEQTGASVKLINEKYSKMKTEIDRQEYRAKISMAGDLAGQLATVLGEQTVAGKAAAITQATINTYLGASKAIAEGGFWGIAQAAVVIATGLAQVAKIVAVKAEKPEVTEPTKRYAKGGKLALFGGRSHADGGTVLRGTDGSVLEVERGEAAFVLNKRATAAISSLSALNQAYGGVSFAKTGMTYFAQGGQITTLGAQSVSMSKEMINQLAEVVIGAVREMPTPVVQVTDINTATSNLSDAKKISVI